LAWSLRGQFQASSEAEVIVSDIENHHLEIMETIQMERLQRRPIFNIKLRFVTEMRPGICNFSFMVG
jgi:hypothetical protein